MAGIGFEIRKIIRGNTLANQIKGVAYATLVSVGPMVISVFMIVLIGLYMKQTQVPVIERDLVHATLMYAYIFAMVNVSGIAMILSRYLADQIYLKNHEHVLSSLLGSAAVLIAAGGIVSIIFYSFSELDLIYKFLAYMLFLELSCLYLLMVYLSAVKDYKKISLSFFSGMMLTIFLIIILRPVFEPATVAILLSVNLGFLLNLIIMLHVITRHFKSISKRSFCFFRYINKMPLLFLTNIFYTFGLFSHNILFWLLSDLSVQLEDTYLFAPAYDNATFYAVLTIIPSTVLFVIKVETSFYEKYREFCSIIVNGGNLKTIDLLKENMVATLQKELSSLFEIQFLVTLVMIILGAGVILPAMGADSLLTGIYATLSIGYFLTQMLFIIVTMLLYFDDQEDACKATGLFMASTILFTLITLPFGHAVYGLGFCLGATISLVYGVLRLNRLLDKVDYRLFSKPPYMNQDEMVD